MKMVEIVEQISFLLGLPANENVEDLQIEKAVNIAFRELKRYMSISTDKTVPFSTRIDLKKVGIEALKILNVQESYPHVGLTLGNIGNGNVFEIAAAVGTMNTVSGRSQVDMSAIMSQLALGQVRNVLSTDLQWRFDRLNQVVWCTHKQPFPATVTIKYVPDFQDVSEVTEPTYVDYLIRMSTANMKVALGRSRSKYKIEGSNVTLDGDTLLAEGNAELEQIREELTNKRRKLVVVN